MTNSVDPSLLLENYRPPERKTGNQILGKDDFLKILLVQLQNQDPLNPMEDKEFIAQMANFSTLEQMINISSMFERLMQTQNNQALLRYSEWIGKNVYWQEEENTKSGVVKSVLQKDNQIFLELDNGSTINASLVIKVESK
ncbi:flagellar hook assembly protein FlgD [Parageobacillus thermoglucosidasius]|uniref:Flagellar hook capping protein n=1 Tax=Geobacillus sp. (strain Y4.1MC1) TaxID=581103 RepID=A0A7U4DLC7_GEOS0|nr:flagellar hook assembly protein FlgD [Parageobacillus thermoglucosidasius]AEH48582.1 flagellar hook capping protein [Parageobacillus thermoglucosidasius C56-YS93]MBY6267664.1 flagellar hook assembly protein FlgD [Parageobacillus thermoglucosidasius]OUM94324.1 MAG: flagellar biosynthesis protein FlgD [Parageobacillus thermoglucosidasius]RDE34434.1 flagellar hook assembly protein FlgD [Parageobacillus thermoglucosidasius]